MRSKEEMYELVTKQAESIMEGETDTVAIMSNFAALLHHTFQFWWTGFYRVKDNELLLGPFQGPVACMHIGYCKGVCGTAWKERRSVVVDDVTKFPGHIACSPVTRSEIVVPIFRDEEVVAIIDIDSSELANFNDVDRRCLEELASKLSAKISNV